MKKHTQQQDDNRVCKKWNHVRRMPCLSRMAEADKTVIKERSAKNDASVQAVRKRRDFFS